jgi:hypothetical protein
MPQPNERPIPCGTSTGFAGAESHVVVTAGGTVIYTPAVLPAGTLGSGEGPPVDPATQANASPAGVAASGDNGATWSLVRPDGLTWNPTDHAEYIDPSTGRFFFENYGPIPLAPTLGLPQEGPAYLISTDDFHTWHLSVIAGLVLPENPRFVSAPAPGGEPLPVGYPRVLYFCANTNVGFVSPAILGRLCFRSLDGGTTWQASQVFGGLLPTHPQCGLSGEDFTAVDGYYPEPSSNGTLYLLVSCGGRTYLARSTDEAASFPIIYARGGPLEVPAPADSLFSVFPALGTGPQLRIDPQDNMYLVYPAVTGQTISKLFLRISQDRGLSWSRPLDITPPGVSAILRWAVAERGLGNLAVTYVARRQGASTWDGYVSETNDALDALRAGGEPLFWSGVANREPLMYADTIRGAGNIALGEGQLAAPYPSPLGIDPAGGLFSAGNDFIGATIGPDGTPWGTFNQDCGPSPQAAGCRADGDQTRGFAARLAWPGRSNTCGAASGPQASIDRRPRTLSRQTIVLTGRANRLACSAGAAVARVEAAIARKSRNRCRFLTPHGHLGRATSCSRPRYLVADGTTRWSLRRHVLFPRGRYVVSVLAVDTQGRTGPVTQIRRTVN